MEFNTDDPFEHMHLIEAQDGDVVCIDVSRWAGKVFNLSWYAIRSQHHGSAEFDGAVQ